MQRTAETLFTGSHTHKIDQKGRIAAPADFRRALKPGDVNGFYCVPSLLGPFLECGGPDFLERLRSMIGALAPYEEDRIALQEALIGAMRLVSFDADGRFILPADFRRFSKLDGEAFFIGCGETFQIRSAEGAEERAIHARERARKALLRLENPVLSPGPAGPEKAL